MCIVPEPKITLSQRRVRKWQGQRRLYPSIKLIAKHWLENKHDRICHRGHE